MIFILIIMIPIHCWTPSFFIEYCPSVKTPASLSKIKSFCGPMLASFINFVGTKSVWIATLAFPALKRLQRNKSFSQWSQWPQIRFNINLEASSNFARSKAFLSGLGRVETLTARQGGRLASFSFSFSAARSFMRFQLVLALQISVIYFFIIV